MGCVRLGSVSGGRSWRDDVRLVQQAVDRGVRVFDTADAYGNGISETVLGRALQGRRSDVVIATKGGYCFAERRLGGHTSRRLAHAGIAALRSASKGKAPQVAEASSPARTAAYAEQDFSARHLAQAIDASLRRLQTDHIDLYQLHGPHEVLPAVAAQMADVVRSGKIGAFGIGAESVSDALGWVGLDGVSNVQVPFGMMDPQAADVLFARTDELAVGVWARGVLGGGVLSSVMRDDPGARNDPKADLIRQIRELADSVGTTVYQLAVDYVRSFPAVSLILIGLHSSEQLSANLDLFADARTDAAAQAALASIIDRWVDAHEPI